MFFPKSSVLRQLKPCTGVCLILARRSGLKIPLLQLWSRSPLRLGFHSWPRNFHKPRVRPRKKKKKMHWPYSYFKVTQIKSVGCDVDSSLNPSVSTAVTKIHLGTNHVSTATERVSEPGCVRHVRPARATHSQFRPRPFAARSWPPGPRVRARACASSVAGEAWGRSVRRPSRARAPRW